MGEVEVDDQQGEGQEGKPQKEYAEEVAALPRLGLLPGEEDGVDEGRGIFSPHRRAR